MTLNKNRLIFALSAAIIIVMGAFYVFLSKNTPSQLQGPSAFLLGAPFSLIDHEGQPITEKAFQGAPSLLVFGFTHCSEICSATLSKMETLLDRAGKEAEGVRVFFVTVDPERDQGNIFKDYVTNFPRVTGITGSEEELRTMVGSWGVHVEKVLLEDGEYTMDHTASVFMVNSEGNFSGTIAYGEDLAVAQNKIRVFLAKSEKEDS